MIVYIEVILLLFSWLCMYPTTKLADKAEKFFGDYGLAAASVWLFWVAVIYLTVYIKYF